jgi:hypothetical protein
MVYVATLFFLSLFILPVFWHFQKNLRTRWVVVLNILTLILAPVALIGLSIIVISLAHIYTYTNLPGWVNDLDQGFWWGTLLYSFFVVFGLPTRHYWKGLSAWFFQFGAAFDPRLGPNKYSTKVGENKYLSGTKKTTGSKKLADSNLPKPSELTLSGLWNKYFKKK